MAEPAGELPPLPPVVAEPPANPEPPANSDPPEEPQNRRTGGATCDR